MSLLHVSAFSYCKETLTAARKTGIRIAAEIKECIRWQVVCVDPEHLHDKEWREITESPMFRENVLFAAVDEVHLINEWGLSFRLAFATIGVFLRGRFPASISVVGLTATLEPGAATTSVCKSLGFFEGNFLFIRRSNERPNTQFGIQFLSHGLNGDNFPDLLPYLASGRKTIIHCRTVEQVSRVYAFIWRVQPEGASKLNRARVYHSICPPDYNKETIQLLETDPSLQIVISTVAFSNGINAKSLLDSLSLGFGATFNESWQEKGRVGRDPSTIGRGVILSHRSIIKDASVYLASISVALNASQAGVQGQNKSKKKGGKPAGPRVFDHSKALVVTETKCYIACINACYDNPSHGLPDQSRSDCISASRQLPCSLCLSRAGQSIEFPPSPALGAVFPPLSAALARPHTITPPTLLISKKNKLTKKERAIGEAHFIKFGESVRQVERESDSHKYRPRSSYFPSRIVSAILDTLLMIRDPSHLDNIISSNPWSYHTTHGAGLLHSITQIQTSILAERKAAQERTSAKRREKQQGTSESANTTQTPNSVSSGSNSVEQHSIIDERSEHRSPCTDVIEPPFPSRKRQASAGPEEITNTVPQLPVKRQRAARAAQPTVAQAQEDFGPRYRTRRAAGEKQKENIQVEGTGLSLRRSRRN